MVGQKQLTQVFGTDALSNKVELLIPRTFRVNEPDPAAQAVFAKYTELAFSEMFGGASTAYMRGSYIAQDGTQVREIMAFVGAYMNDADLLAYARDILELAYAIKKFMRQESIGLIVNGSLRFI